MREQLIRFVDNLDRDKTGRVLFGVGVIGFMISGICLDSSAWAVALIGVIMSVGICYVGYQMTDLTERIRWESRQVREKKQNNRESTYERWIQTTKMP